MTRSRIAVFLAVMMLLVACGGGGERSDLSGEELAAEIGCLGCHQENPTDIAPTLHGIWGTEVTLQTGGTVTVDEAYVRRSITEPGADIVDGFGTSMPIFELSDSEVDRLVDWVESLG